MIAAPAGVTFQLEALADDGEWFNYGTFGSQRAAETEWEILHNHWRGLGESLRPMRIVKTTVLRDIVKDMKEPTP